MPAGRICTDGTAWIMGTGPHDFKLARVAAGFRWPMIRFDVALWPAFIQERTQLMHRYEPMAKEADALA